MASEQTGTERILSKAEATSKENVGMVSVRLPLQ